MGCLALSVLVLRPKRPPTLPNQHGINRNMLIDGMAYGGYSTYIALNQKRRNRAANLGDVNRVGTEDRKRLSGS